MTAAPSIGLADLIRDHRHIIELRTATPAELSAITGHLDDVGTVKGFLRGWQAITIRDHLADVKSLHIVGFFAMRSWITSDLLRLSRDRSFVRTRNSIYALGKRAETDLSVAHLITVARALRAWGIVDQYGLEVVREDELAEIDDE